MEIRGEEHADRGKSEAKRAQRETFLLAQIVSNGSRRSAANNASHQRTSRSPANARRVQMKQLAQISNRAADDNVVVSKQETAKRRDTRRNDERSTRLGQTRWRVQIIRL